MRKTGALREDAARLLIRAVAYAYDDILLAETQRWIAVADMEFIGQLLKDAQNKFDAGAAPYIDLLNFQIRYKNAVLNLTEVEYYLKSGKYVLAGYLGLTDGSIPENVRTGKWRKHGSILSPRFVPHMFII